MKQYELKSLIVSVMTSALFIVVVTSVALFHNPVC